MMLNQIRFAVSLNTAFASVLTFFTVLSLISTNTYGAGGHDLPPSNIGGREVFLSFNAPTIISGVPINTTISFSPGLIDLSKMNSTQIVTLELKDEGMQKGQHMLAVSATDGAIVKTVYVELMVK